MFDATKMRRTAVLVILDGWGIDEGETFNAVRRAKTPAVDRAFGSCPLATLVAHGVDVGLPAGQMGNSEVGHTNIGAGRVVEMDLPRLNRVFGSARCEDVPEIRAFLGQVARAPGRVHLFGILSDGGVHGHQDHLVKMANMLVAAGARVCLHLATDGRDVAPKSALYYLAKLQEVLWPEVEIATLGGRYFAMDRNQNWDRTKRSYEVMCGRGPCFGTAQELIKDAYARDVLDEFITPARLGRFSGITDGDALLFMNYRADRVRQIAAAFGDTGLPGLEAADRPKLGFLGGLVKYSDRHDRFMSTLFPEPEIRNTLGECVAAAGLAQIRAAETEKYAHVTFFLNGGKETPFPGEDRLLEPSPDVATYDLRPEMAAAEVARRVRDAILSEAYQLVVVNFANPDMVGHTGDLAAAVEACEAVDAGVADILEACAKVGATALITADHGNCEIMQNTETGEPHTAHTINPVPVCLVNGPSGMHLRQGGRLADIAPTLLELLGIAQPAEMTGRSLLEVVDAKGVSA